ncbi:hypothetical protein AX16_007134 [Volvariella volvacea WC 439]|nr:hypothetical protein AX16_007134 [Volvariella volvacea WC 439]
MTLFAPWSLIYQHVQAIHKDQSAERHRELCETCKATLNSYFPKLRNLEYVRRKSKEPGPLQVEEIEMLARFLNYFFVGGRAMERVVFMGWGAQTNNPSTDSLKDYCGQIEWSDKAIDD